ncbi:MAG TPA: histidine phosphatase family protein [Pirellulaceae bacterium]|nr:histidine phosphatase family protein [Pirellulaceae bacterium]
MYPSPAPDTCVLFLLRHGATDNNLMRPPKLQGRGVDLGLSLEGRRQATRAAQTLAEQQISAVYSSTLLRAKETAEIIAQPHRLAVTTDERLVEVDVGKWEMRSWVDIAKEEPEAYQRFQTDPGTHGYAGGENLQQVLLRVLAPITAIVAAHPGEQIVIVGHNVVNRAFLAGVLDLPMARARHLHQENCGLNVLEYKAGEMKLVTLNSVLHLF